MGWREQNTHRIGSGYAVHPNIRFAVFLVDVKDARRAKRVRGSYARTTRSISMSTRFLSAFLRWLDNYFRSTPEERMADEYNAYWN